MSLEIYKNQSPYLFKKRLKTEYFRLSEKFCHLNLLDIILNESSSIFSFLVGNPPHINLGKFLILIYCPQISPTNQITGFSKLYYSRSS